MEQKDKKSSKLVQKMRCKCKLRMRIANANCELRMRIANANANCELRMRIANAKCECKMRMRCESDAMRWTWTKVRMRKTFRIPIPGGQLRLLKLFVRTSDKTGKIVCCVHRVQRGKFTIQICPRPSQHNGELKRNSYRRFTGRYGNQHSRL